MKVSHELFVTVALGAAQTVIQMGDDQGAGVAEADQGVQ
jgi:hypothetical protein